MVSSAGQFSGEPPFIENPDGVGVQEIIESAKLLWIQRAQLDFLGELMHEIADTPHGRLSVYDLAERMQVHHTTVRRKLRALVEVGLIDQNKERMLRGENKPRKITVYTLVRPSVTTIQARQEDIVQRSSLSEESHQVIPVDRLTSNLSVDRSPSLYIDMVMHLLFRALSHSRRDRTTYRELVLQTHWRKKIPMVVTSQAGTPIARVTDLISGTALLSVCFNDLRDRKMMGQEITNEFVIRGGLLCKTLRITRGDYLYETLLRLNNTQFNLSNLPSTIFQKWQGFKGGVDMHHRLLHQLERFRLEDDAEEDGLSKRPSEWAFSWVLPPNVFQVLCNKLYDEPAQLFSLSDFLLDESNNIIASLYLYCRQTLLQIDSRVEIGLEELRLQVAPEMQRYRFFTVLGEGIYARYEYERTSAFPIRATTDTEGNPITYVPMKPVGYGENPVSKHLPLQANVEIYGFVFILDGDRVVLERNTSDPIVGFSSPQERRRLIEGRSARSTTSSFQTELDLGDQDEPDLDF